MYGAGTGLYISTIDKNNLLLDVILASHTTVHGHGFIRHFARCPRVVSRLLRRHDSLSTVLPIHNIAPSKCESFWKYQATLIHGCRRCHGLCALIVHMNYAPLIILLRHIDKVLSEDGLLFHQVLVYYPAFGEFIDSTACVVIGFKVVLASLKPPSWFHPLLHFRVLLALTYCGTSTRKKLYYILVSRECFVSRSIQHLCYLPCHLHVREMG